MWTVLDKAGSSNTEERIALLRRYLALFGAGSVRRCPEQTKIALHEFDALSGCRIACMVQKSPHERHSEAARDDG